MNDQDKADFLNRFSKWLVLNGIKLPTSVHVYKFLETNR